MVFGAKICSRIKMITKSATTVTTMKPMRVDRVVCWLDVATGFTARMPVATKSAMMAMRHLTMPARPIVSWPVVVTGSSVEIFETVKRALRAVMTEISLMKMPA
jgi:hypothetical protein